MDQSDFVQQIATYKDQLTTDYNSKIQIISLRETQRYNYLNAWKTQFESIVADIFTDLLNADDADTILLFSAFIQALKMSIPMCNMDGSPLTDWKNPATVVSAWQLLGDHNLSFLSPQEDWLENDYSWQNPGVKPYQLNASILVNQASTSKMRNINSLTEQMAAFGSGGFGSLIQDQITFPVQPDWMNTFVSMSGLAPTLTLLPSPYVVTAVNNVVAYLVKSYGPGTLSSCFNSGEQLYYQILNDTVQMLLVQNGIDQVEDNLSDFVDQAQTTTLPTLADLQSSVSPSLTPAVTPTSSPSVPMAGDDSSGSGFSILNFVVVLGMCGAAYYILDGP